MDSVSKCQTTVCIAHRLSTIKRADKIVVLSRGEVVEEGTHDQLYAQNGVYRGLVDAQHISVESEEELEKRLPEPEHSEVYLSEFTSAVKEITPVRRSETMKNISKSGVLEEKKYTTMYLLKKVFLYPQVSLIYRHSNLIHMKEDGCLSGGV